MSAGSGFIAPLPRNAIGPALASRTRVPKQALVYVETAVLAAPLRRDP